MSSKHPGGKSEPTSVWVEPVAPLEAQVIQCSAIENLCAPVYPTMALFFRFPDSADALVPFEHLRRGLSRRIYQDKILAGRFKKDKRSAFSVVIPAPPHAGTRFYYRDLRTDKTFPDLNYLAKAGFPFADGKLDGLGKLRPEQFPISSDEDPVIIPQLTRIRGGLVLTVSISHLVLDLVRYHHFVKQWAADTRALSEAAVRGRLDPQIPHQFPDVLIDNSRLCPRPQEIPFKEASKIRSSIMESWQKVDPSDPVGLMAILENFRRKASIPPCTGKEEDELRKPLVGVWHFSQADLNAIRSTAQAGQAGEKLSTMDALVAFLWKRYYLAKYHLDDEAFSKEATHDNGTPEESTIVYAIDIRGKLQPPLPPGYMGAAVDLVRVQAPRSVLVDDGRGSGDAASSLATLALAVRKAGSTWDEKSYMMLLSMSQQSAMSPGFLPRGPVELLVTDHRLQSSNISADWGAELGQSMTWREPYVGRDFPAGEVAVMPSPKAGDLEVQISAERVILERLLSNPQMRAFSTQRFMTHDIIKSYEERATPGTSKL